MDQKIFSPISVEPLSQRQQNIESSRQFSKKLFLKSCLLFSYQIDEAIEQEDGSLIVRIRKQYNDKADVSEYFK